MQLDWLNKLGLVSASLATGSLAGAAMANPAVANPLDTPVKGSGTTAPVYSELRLKHMHYQESQNGQDRMTVKAPSLGFTLALSEAWSAQGYLVSDGISGASPAYYTNPDSFVSVNDERNASDLRVSRHWTNSQLTLGLAYSREDDYQSRNTSLLWRESSPDRNQTYELGYSITRDTINPVTGIVVNEKKNVQDWLVGVGLVLSPLDVVQLTLVHGQGRGYYTDPYKRFDRRPSRKHQTSLNVQWNHHFETSGRSARLGLRFYQDSFGIDSATFSSELHQPLASGWSVTPLLRLYSQSAAYFFSPPDPQNPNRINIPQGHRLGQDPISFDQRLAALGAYTLGLKVEKRVSAQLSLDFKYEVYKQANRWSRHANNTPGLEDFKAQSVQLGLTRRF